MVEFIKTTRKTKCSELAAINLHPHIFITFAIFIIVTDPPSPSHFLVMGMLTADANGGAGRRFRFRLPLLVGCCIDDDDLKGAAAVGGGSLGCNNGESSFASLFIETLALCNFSV